MPGHTPGTRPQMCKSLSFALGTATDEETGLELTPGATTTIEESDPCSARFRPEFFSSG